jgi:hypothetical protein
VAFERRHFCPGMADDDPPEQTEDDAAPAEQPTVDASNSTTLTRKQVTARVEYEQARKFWSDALRDEVGGRELWKFIQATHAFEERYEQSPVGFPVREGIWFRAGEQSVGLRFYHLLAKLDRAGVLALHDKFDSTFAAPKLPRRRRRVP